MLRYSPTACAFATCLAFSLLALPGIVAADPVQDAAALIEADVRKVHGTPGRRYEELCGVCHGNAMQGTAQGTPLIGMELRHGDTIADLAASIRNGDPSRGMPAWNDTLAASEIRMLAQLIVERRRGYVDYNYRMDNPLDIPKGTVETHEHAFRLEAFAENIERFTFSIAPLPDGRLLLTEKMRGLRLFEADGRRSMLIAGTPRVYDDAQLAFGVTIGLGWLADIATHPEYAHNGWVYLHYTERCEACNEASRRANAPVSMNKIVRGRIRDDTWVDEEVVWNVGPEFYSVVPDAASGGRLCFDDEANVYFSTGMKGGALGEGVQDLNTPHGKIHRVADDGTIPPTNPYVGRPGAMASIWNYGHRNAQGLEFDVPTGRLWATDHGPRGGDEINLLRPGANYGWPLHSLGMNYEGTPVDYGKQLDIEWNIEDIEQPVVDFTPSLAVSSFVVYRGKQFPNWDGDIILGTLKDSTLYRVRLPDEGPAEVEPLTNRIAPIRDVEVDRDGNILLLLEHESGGAIVRMLPVSH